MGYVQIPQEYTLQNHQGQPAPSSCFFCYDYLWK